MCVVLLVCVYTVRESERKNGNETAKSSLTSAFLFFNCRFFPSVFFSSFLSSSSSFLFFFFSFLLLQLLLSLPSTGWKRHKCTQNTSTHKTNTKSTTPCSSSSSSFSLLYQPSLFP